MTAMVATPVCVDDVCEISVASIGRPKRMSALKAQQLISEKLQRENAMGAASDDDDEAADPSVQFGEEEESEYELEEGEIVSDGEDGDSSAPDDVNKRKAGNGKSPKDNKAASKKGRKEPARKRKAPTAADMTQDETSKSDVEVTKKAKEMTEESSPTSPIDDAVIDIEGGPAVEYIDAECGPVAEKPAQAQTAEESAPGVDEPVQPTTETPATALFLEQIIS